MNPQAAHAAPNPDPTAPPSERLSPHGLNWATFWQQLEQRLRDEGYKPATVRLYRQVLRDLRRFLCS